MGTSAIDFGKLKEVLASPAAASLPPVLRQKMQQSVLENDQKQMQVRPDVTQVTNPVVQAQHTQTGLETAANESVAGSAGGAIMKSVFQVGHDMTFGIIPSAYSKDPNQMTGIQNATEIPVKLVSGLGTMIIQGAGLMRGLSYVGRAPVVARALEFIPGRMKEIGLGALINGGIDAMRADGLDREPNGAINDVSWLDPSAKIAKPLAELGIPDRVALGLGGAVVGSVVGPILMGMAAGYQAGRAAKFASKLGPAEVDQIKSAITRAGIDLGTSATKFDVAKTFITNFRKIALNEQTGAIMADQLSKEQYIANEMAMGSANNAQPLMAGQTVQPLSEEQGRLVANIFRNNPGGVNVVTDMTSSEAINVAKDRLGMKLISIEIPAQIEGEKIVAAGIKIGDRTFQGPIHGSAMRAASEAGLQFTMGTDQIGFVTSKGRFVPDNEALAIGQRGKQLGTSDNIHNIGSESFRAKDANFGTEQVSPLGLRSELRGEIPNVPNTFHLMVARPNYEYPSFAAPESFGRLTKKITETMKKMAATAASSVTAPRTTEAFILADGTPIRGGLNLGSMTEKMKLQQPIVGGVARGDLGLQEAGKFVRLEIHEGGKLSIDLPKSMSKEQFSALGQAIDTMKFNTVEVNFGTQTKSFDTPIGAVVQDHIVDMVPPSAVTSPITPAMIRQYAKTGVFEGQAAILPDGTVAKVLNKASGTNYRVVEQLSGKILNVHGKNLTILPTALQGELQPSNLFTSYLSEAERTSLAKLRSAVQQGWAEPIKKYRDLESFANTRGYIANSLRGGKVELLKVNEGTAASGTIKFENLAAAADWIRNDSGPMAELAADDVSKLLGPDRNLGFIGGGGPPSRFNEMMPIDWERQQRTLESLGSDRGPGAGGAILKPMLPYLRDLDQKFGTQMYKSAYNMQTQGVARDNFTALWYHGKDGVLPDGVMPLKKIIQMAGKGADAELISHWLEAPDTIARMELEKGMTRPELASAQQLRKWYDAAYPALGINAPFVENYMPRYREFLQTNNAGSFEEFMAHMGGDPLKVPKGTDFVSDHIREGTIDAYEKNAFAVAQQYLRAGAKNRFMKQAQDEAREMVRGIAAKNPNLALPLANMLQAMGGYEFAEQRAMLNETFKTFLDKFPGALKTADKAALSEKLTDWSTSLVYSSTMGFRPSLALRNAKDVFVMAYPIYHGPRFMEALGHALTTAGKQEAMAARAISSYGGAMLNIGDLETIQKLPEWMQKVQHASTMLYDSADDFTRAGTFHAAKFKTEAALEKFAATVAKDIPKSQLDKAISTLVKDSKIYMYGDEVKDEFLRLAGNSPDQAATYSGKVASDMVNFIYGRGMQARWMRSIGGRLMGQFGSWSMWYGDYLNRMVRGVMKGPYRADALGALGRHALINAAILGVGKEVLDIDLSRWASYGALFYSGGPGAQIAMGAATLQRGLGDASTLGEDPLAQSRISQGSQMIWNTLPAFVPFFSAGRDVLRMVRTESDWQDDPSKANATDFLAATLGSRTTQDFQARRKVDILLGDYQRQPISSTSPALHTQLNNQALGTGVQSVDLRAIQGSTIVTPGVSNPVPAEAGSGASPLGANALNVRIQSNLKNRGQVAPFAGPGEVKNRSTSEAPPSKGY